MYLTLTYATCIYAYKWTQEAGRPDLTVSGTHSPRLFSIFESLLFYSCLFVPQYGCRCSLSCHSPLQVGVGVRRDRRECQSWGDCRRLWLLQARCSRKMDVAIRGSPRPAVRGKIDDAVQGSPKPAADSSPPARR